MSHETKVTAVLRIARPTTRLEELAEQYRAGLGFTELGRFDLHSEGITGIMLGHPGQAYHLEFTSHRGAPPAPPPSPEQLLVFYLPDAEAWRLALARSQAAGLRKVAAANPYWDEHGATLEDLDGHRLVLTRQDWRAMEARNLAAEPPMG